MSNRSTPSVRCRPAAAADSSDLAILADAATRRLMSWLWDAGTAAGQSSFEVGRDTIRSNDASTSHYSRWRVATLGDRVVGATNAYPLAPSEPPASQAARDVLAPLTELKSIAADTWYVSVASVFPEARGTGVGRMLLADAEHNARAAGIARVTLIVASFNPDARRLYERVGFAEWEQRPFHPFPGSDAAGEWILMRQDLASR